MAGGGPTRRPRWARNAASPATASAVPAEQALSVGREEPVEHMACWDLTLGQLGRVITVRGKLMHTNLKDVISHEVAVTGVLDSFSVLPPTSRPWEHGTTLLLNVRGAVVMVTSDVVARFSGPPARGYRQAVEEARVKRREAEAARAKRLGNAGALA